MSLIRAPRIDPGAVQVPLGARALAGEESVMDEVREDERARALEAAYERGCADGQAEAQARLEAPLLQAAASLEAAAADCIRQERVLAETAERWLARLALAIANRVVQREVDRDGEAIATRLATAAVDRLGNRDGIVIRAHPEDVAAITRALARAAGDGEPECRVIESVDVERGGCVIEDAQRRVDARIEEQLRLIGVALGVENESENG